MCQKSNTLQTAHIKLLLVSAMAFGALASQPSQAGIADPNRVHNLTQNTWHTTLNDAIDATNNSDELVANPSVYQEVINLDGKSITLRSTDPTDPNIVATTIIDGSGLNDNVVSCVSGETAGTVFSGFTVTGGNPSGIFPDNSGGGMYNSGSSPTVTYCTFSGNTAYYGGGMYNNNSNPDISHCSFTGNIGATGGGMCNDTNSSPAITQCVFNANMAGSGGAMYNRKISNPVMTTCSFASNEATGNVGGAIFNVINSSPLLIDCTFMGNNCIYDGGGIYITSDSTITVNDCTFTGNIATNGVGGGIYTLSRAKIIGTGCNFIGNEAMLGGGMYHGSSGVSTITACRFEGNMATSGEGGGLYNTGGGSLAMKDNFFSGNSSTTTGGGVYNTGGNTAFDHCIFSGNTAGTTGAGMYNESAGPQISHCSFSANAAGNNGGGIFNANSSPTMINSIVHGNTPNAVIHNGGSTAASYCVIQGGIAGTGIIDADPLFIDADGPDDAAGTDDDNLRLQATSPAIDAGDTISVPLENVSDLGGNPRAPDDPETADTGLSIVIPLTGENAVTDIGAYEFQPVDSCVNTLDADINCDGQVNLTDLVMLALEWLQMP